jgi:hypothetical protein
MSFDWTNYLNLAQELTGSPIAPSNEEAKLRSAISRAYYAAFIKARNYLRDQERYLTPAGGNPHYDVPLQFQQSSDAARRAIGVNLNRLRKDRNVADYADRFNGLSAASNLAIQRAIQILVTLSRL